MERASPPRVDIFPNLSGLLLLEEDKYDSLSAFNVEK